MGHRAEMRQTIGKAQFNSARNRLSGKGEILWGTLQDRTLVFTHEGIHVSLAVTLETHSTLVEFMRRTFAAFPESLPKTA